MGDRNLDRLAIQDLGKVDRVADRLFRLAGQAENEVAVNGQAEVVAVLGEGARALNGCALLDVLEDLRIARLEADDQQTASGFVHRLQRVVVGGHARSAAPRNAERLQLLAELDGAHLLNVERVVVEEEFLHFREVLLRPFHLGRNIISRPLAPRMPAQGLRPQAERALRRAAARGVKRDVRMQQERHVVARHVHVALVDLGGPGHRIQVFDLRAVGVVDDLAVYLVADAENLVQRLALRELDDGVVELAAADEVERGALVQRAVGVDVVTGGPTKADLRSMGWRP